MTPRPGIDPLPIESFHPVLKSVLSRRRKLQSGKTEGDPGVRPVELHLVESPGHFLESPFSIDDGQTGDDYRRRIGIVPYQVRPKRIEAVDSADVHRSVVSPERRALVESQ